MKTYQINREEAKQILSNDTERGIFLLEYPYFGKDNNEDIYKEFILNSLSKGTGVDSTTDAIHLAIKIGSFNNKMFKMIKKNLLSRRNYLVRLACFDYVVHNRDIISKKEFRNICETLLKSRNELLRVQAITSLLTEEKKYYSKLIRLLERANYPTSFYRALNDLADNKVKLGNQDNALLRQLILSKKFNSSVKNELLKAAERIRKGSKGDRV